MTTERDDAGEYMADLFGGPERVRRVVAEAVADVPFAMPALCEWPLAGLTSLGEGEPLCARAIGDDEAHYVSVRGLRVALCPEHAARWRGTR